MEVLSMLLKYQVPFVLGTIFLEQNAVDPAKVDIYNSALLLKPGRGIAGRYSKEHIVPFGEYALNEIESRNSARRCFSRVAPNVIERSSRAQANIAG